MLIHAKDSAHALCVCVWKAKKITMLYRVLQRELCNLVEVGSIGETIEELISKMPGVRHTTRTHPSNVVTTAL